MKENDSEDIVWYNRHMMLSSVGVTFTNKGYYKESDIVTVDFKGLSLRFQYKDEGTDRCLYVLLKAEKLHRDFYRRIIYKLFHRCPRQTSFDIENPKESEKTVRAVLDRM